MKTTVRIFMLATILALAGALATAWGAESVASLITQGEAATDKTNSAKAALDAAVKKNDALVAEGKSITAEQQQMQADIDALKKASADFNQKASDYDAACAKPKSTDQYNACKAQNAQLKQLSDQLKAEPAQLNKRQNDWVARATKYNQDVKAAPKEVSAADTAFRNALINQYQWLDKARVLVASPAFGPYAKKAGCPDVKNPAKTTESAMKMSSEILTCLKKVAGSN
jgi:chromosome segregation ATPase